jgi:two-component system, NarL family, invasion response regulator UvrY
MNKNIKVALVDDHVILRNGLAAIVTKLGYNVLFECSNGTQLMTKLDKTNQPDLILMDINMPEMDGYQTTLWLRNNYPLIKVLALSMYDDEKAIIRMIRNGARGYILKETDMQELKKAIDSVLTKGFHYSDLVTGRLIHSIAHNDESDNNHSHTLDLNDREIEFLKLACTEMTYKEIALEMHLSPRTIDGYRDALFEKLNIKSRVGLVIFAIKNGIIYLDQLS